MATKKEKRARAEAKHNEEMEALRQSGLKAQRADRARRARGQKRSEEAAIHESKELKKIIEKGVFIDEQSMPFGEAVPGA